MTSVKSYPYTTGTPSGTPVTTSLGYSVDKLTSFGSKSITYNSNGGVSSYDGWDYTWSKGRLSSVRKELGSSSRAITPPLIPNLNSSKTYSFIYNAFGQRVKSNYSYFIANDSITSIGQDEVVEYTKAYSYDNSGRLISESITEELYGGDTASSEIVFLYDESSMVGMQYTSALNETDIYYYLRNLQGDVIAIYDTNGNKVVEYAYDAWGNCTIKSTTTNYTVAHVNPIRYRGYYYDENTGLYYLNSRYYNPEWRRFISPDSTDYLDPETVNGLNLYVYCNNDPVNYCDPSGHKLELLGWLVVGALIVTSIAITVASFGTLSGVAIGALAVTGAVTGGFAGALNAASTGGDIGQGIITGALVGIAGAFSPLAGGLMAAGMSLMWDRINNKKFNPESMGKAALSAVTAYIFAYGSAEFANLMLASGGDALLTWAAYGVSNFIFASHNFVTDTILHHILK